MPTEVFLSRRLWGGAALGALALMLAWSCGPTEPSGPSGPETSCTNGLDDNGDGLVDCADPTCTQNSNCVGKPGGTCAVQLDCVDGGYGFVNPLGLCEGGRCYAPDAGIEVRLEVNTLSYAGCCDGRPFGTLNTRFVRKQALDGGAVSCAVLQGAAASRLALDADQLERSDRFNMLGYDISRIQGATPGMTIAGQVRTGTGRDFIVWTELWSGAPDSNTRLPTGQRWGWGCVEEGDEVREFRPEDHWPAAGPTATSRTIKVRMPGPNG
jgi:hypothetical protein